MRKRHISVYKSHRAGWLRAAVLGANDGIVSTGSLMVGVATATNDAAAILTAGIAGLVAGALSMAAGEYVSVSSQRDSERADIALKAEAIRKQPDKELARLIAVYEARGLSPQLARQVARELQARDGVSAHARDVLGIADATMAHPWQAAAASAASFSVGAALPILAAVLMPGEKSATWTIVVISMVGLAIFGAIGAFIGGGNRWWAGLRVLVGGGLAMAVTAAIGHLIGIGL